jgi:hypothetical protein
MQRDTLANRVTTVTAVFGHPAACSCKLTTRQRAEMQITKGRNLEIQKTKIANVSTQHVCFFALSSFRVFVILRPSPLRLL